MHLRFPQFDFGGPEMAALPLALLLTWLFYRFVFTRLQPPSSSLSAAAMASTWAAFVGLIGLALSAPPHAASRHADEPSFAQQTLAHLGGWGLSLGVALALLQLLRLLWLLARRAWRGSPGT